MAGYAKTIKNLPKGDKGDMPSIDYGRLIPAVAKLIPKPNDGISPDENAISERVAARIRQPKDGETPVLDEEAIAKRISKLLPVQKPLSVDHEAIAELAIDKIKKSKKLKTADIDGFENAETVMRNYAARGFLHGGGDTVTAGTNVTITTDASGKKVINSAGSSGGLAYLAATGTIDNSNKVFTFASTPTIVVVNGASYINGFGVTISGTTATLDNPAGTGGSVYGLG